MQALGGRDRSGALGAEWVLEADGLRHRNAARVLLLDDDGRVLLMRGHDVDEPTRTWWFTIGGGIDGAEDARAAAVREVREETGIVLDVDALVGPVFTRSAVFDFYAEHCRQDETFFVARVSSASGLNLDGWTDVERDVVDEVRWWTPDDLDEVVIEVFPVGLASMARRLAAGWDGIVRVISPTGEVVPAWPSTAASV